MSTYRNSHKPLARIARELAVRFVLEGSVARGQGRVRIATRLIEASTGRNLWAESYERGPEDVIALQSDVALAVAQQIRARLTPIERARIGAPRRVLRCRAPACRRAEGPALGGAGSDAAK